MSKSRAKLSGEIQHCKRRLLLVETALRRHMPQKVKPTAILFDLDDTLVDRAAGLRRYAARLHARFGPSFRSCTTQDVHEALRFADDFGSMLQAEALSASDIWVTPPQPIELYRHWNDHFGSAAMSVPGSMELLRDLRNASVRLGMISNGDSAMQRRKIAAVGLEALMDAIIISSEVGLQKPDRRIFTLALNRLGCSATDAWFVGDHPDQDIRGAASAGLATYWVMTGKYDDVDVPGTHLASVAALRGHLTCLS